MKFKMLLFSMLAATAANAATYTTLDFENARETNTLAYVETNLIAAASNNLAAVIAASEPGDYANVSNKAVNARAYTDLTYIVDGFVPGVPTDAEPTSYFMVDGNKWEWTETSWGGMIVADGYNRFRLLAEYWVSFSLDTTTFATNLSYTSDGATLNITIAGYVPLVANDSLALASDIIAATNAIPAPGNYETVSNRAMSALQSYTETDPTIGNYAAVSNAAMTAGSRIDEIEASTTLIYNLYSSSNALFEVTNYDSRVHIPSARLLSLSSNGTYSVVWDERTNLWANAVAATNYTDAAILAATNRYALRGWSATTSGLGVDAPPETTWISTPTTVIAGGYEFQRNITTSGEMWILTSNGMTATTNGLGFFELTAADGTSVFRVEKTDAYLVGADAGAITVSGNTATISVPVVSTEHPYLRYTPSLATPITWYKEEDSELPSGVTCSWSGTSGAWVCTVTSTATSGFFTFEFVQEGSLKIINGGMTDVSAGLYYNGVKYVPTVNGNKLEFVAE